MNRYKTNILVGLVVSMLAVGGLACANDKAVEITEADTAADTATKVGSEPAAAPAHMAAETAPHHAEPTAADWKTKLQVKMALLENLGTDSLQVDATSHDGAVRLSGTVDKRETKELAETMAKSVPGVTTVRNDILLQSNVDNPSQAGVAAGEAEAELKDAMLSTKVRLALVDVLGSDGFRIGTEVANGMVTLEFAPALAVTRRADAVKATEGVEGVTKVVSVDQT